MASLWVLLGLVVAAYYILSLFLRPLFSARERWWLSQHWPGYSKTSWWPSAMRGSIKSITQTKYMMRNGFKQFSTRNLPFAIPQFNSDPVLVVPPAYVDEYCRKTEADLSFNEFGIMITGAAYNDDVYLFHRPVHTEIVKQYLNKKLPLIIPTLYAEVAASFADIWPATHEWQSRPLYVSCMEIIARTSNSVIGGHDLSRSKAFLDHMQQYTIHLFLSATLITMLPSFIKPVLAPLLTYPVRKHQRACQSIAVPIINKRFEQMQNPDAELPNDSLQWFVEDAQKKGDPIEIEAPMICRRLMRLNMAALHTTSIAITCAILDIVAAPDAKEIIHALQQEVESVLAQNDGMWTKSSVAKLHRCDSVIRESLRFSGLGYFGNNRIVTNPNGITLGDTLHIPAGVRCTTPMDALQQDPSLYPNPSTFDAFRFSRHTESAESFKGSQTLVDTSADYLVFGHGRHACPGRFLAATEMKLMLAHIVTNYDLCLDGSKPEPRYLGIQGMPSTTDILIRKKESKKSM